MENGCRIIDWTMLSYKLILSVDFIRETMRNNAKFLRNRIGERFMKIACEKVKFTILKIEEVTKYITYFCDAIQSNYSCKPRKSKHKTQVSRTG